MTEKLSMHNIGDFAPSNPALDMRQIEEWLAIKREMTRLGVDLSRRVADDVAPRETAAAPRQIQRISLKHF